MAALAHASSVRVASVRPARLAARSNTVLGNRVHAVSNGGKVFAFFKFGKNGANAEAAGIIGAQGKDDFDKDDVEQYFNYMGILAVEGSYDSLWKNMESGIHPADLILNWASMEADLPKIEELLKAGADPRAKNVNGKDAFDLAGQTVPEKKDDVMALLNAKW